MKGDGYGLTSTLICLDCHVTHLMNLEDHVDEHNRSTRPTIDWLRKHAGDDIGVEVED